MVDGAWGKKQDWRPRVRTRGLSEAIVLLKKVLATLLGLFGASHIDSAPGELRPDCLPSLRLWPTFQWTCRFFKLRASIGCGWNFCFSPLVSVKTTSALLVNETMACSRNLRCWHILVEGKSKMTVEVVSLSPPNKTSELGMKRIFLVIILAKILYSRGGEPAARRPNAVRVNIWYGLHKTFCYPC